MKRIETSNTLVPIEIIARRKALDAIPAEQRTLLEVQELERMLEEYCWGPRTIEVNGKRGLLNFDGSMLLKPEFEHVDFLEYHQYDVDALLRVRYNRRYGVITLAEKGGFDWLIAPHYDFISVPQRLTCIRQESQWEIVNVNTKLRLPIEVTDVVLDNGYFLINDIGVYKNADKYGVVMATGEYTIAQFEEVEEVFDGPIRVRKNEDWGFIDESGDFSLDEAEAYYYYNV